MRRFAGLLLFATLAVGQSPTVAQQIASRLTADGLKANVSFLASDALEGRGTPSRGLDIAAEYIAAQFRRAGLEPAGDDGYFQTARYDNVKPNRDGFRLTLQAGGDAIQADSGSVSVDEGAGIDLANAGVVKVVNAAEVDSLTEEQVAGNVLMIDGGSLAGRALTAAVAKLRPALVVLLRPSGRPEATFSRIREAAAQAPVPTITLWDTGIRKALEGKSGVLEATASVHLAAPTSVRIKLRNVIGVLRGSDPQLADTYVMVTAHYDHLGVRGTGEGDHIFNGANDDASGTSSMIEIAGALAALPERPKRSIVFMAVFGEELGLVGSRYYGRHPIFPLAKTVADLNLEQVGRTDDNTGPRVGILNVTGYDYTTIPATLQKAGEDFGVQVQKDERASDAFFARSDNQAFADAGVPAHTLSVGYEFPDYHRATDEWRKLDYDNMAKVARTVALGVLRIADSTEEPDWNAENSRTERYRKARAGSRQ